MPRSNGGTISRVARLVAPLRGFARIDLIRGFLEDSSPTATVVGMLRIRIPDATHPRVRLFARGTTQQPLRNCDVHSVREGSANGVASAGASLRMKAPSCHSIQCHDSYSFGHLHSALCHHLQTSQHPMLMIRIPFPAVAILLAALCAMQNLRA